MKQSPNAPPRANKPVRVPSPDRTPSSSHPAEGPALRVAGASPAPSCAAASLEPAGSAPSSLFTEHGGRHA
jgi:hypothetical protein